MLIEVEKLFPDPTKRSPLSPIHEIIRNIERDYRKYPWFKKLYMDIGTQYDQRHNRFVVECKGPIDVDKYPSMYDRYEVRYIWPGRKKLTIDEAVRKFYDRYHKEQWFVSVSAINQKRIDVILRHPKKDLWKYYEEYPVQYALEKTEGVCSN